MMREKLAKLLAFPFPPSTGWHGTTHQRQADEWWTSTVLDEVPDDDEHGQWSKTDWLNESDRFIELLPHLVDDLRWIERKPGKWVAGVYGLSNPRHDVWELRCMGRRVSFIRGFDEAITRADKHNRARVMAEFGLQIDPNTI